jgi:alpha-amylase
LPDPSTLWGFKGAAMRLFTSLCAPARAGLLGLAIVLARPAVTPAQADLSGENPPNRMVVFQAYWWDCRNDNYPGSDRGGWYTYLTGLVPRLREIGVDALYLPPPSKGASGGFSMGYDPFDHYDLGIKQQKGTVATRFGTQDELLRLIAVAHANGMRVIFDVVLNHCNGDPGNKVFKYRGFDADDTGRWPKSAEDFHGNSQHVPADDDWRKPIFGPDICYRGPCKNDPSAPDTSTYMRDQAARWMRWLTRQTDVDGYRFDAVKHFPPGVVRDVLNAAQPGDQPFFAAGEFVVGQDEQFRIDGWANETENKSGTLDFALREVLLNLSSSRGFDFDLGSLPARQQLNRRKTAPFLNNHDTWRGRFWDSGHKNSDLHDDRSGDFGLIEPPTEFSELLTTVDIDLPRSRVAYAFALAVDGAPVVYFEDLVVNNRLVRDQDPLPSGDPGRLLDPETDDGTTRYKADPRKVLMRPWLRDLIRSRRVLNFQAGSYRVPHPSQDVLVVEREGQALIAMSDNEAEDLPIKVTTKFLSKTLKAYAGPAVDSEVITDGQGVASFRVPKAGIVVYGPEGLDDSHPLPAKPRVTTQTFELAEDLGDNRPGTPGYGGALEPGKERLAGAIYAAEGTDVTVELTTAKARAARLRVYKPRADGSKADRTAPDVEKVEADGDAGPNQAVSHSFKAEREGYYLLAATLTDPGTGKTRGFLKATYTGPVASQAFQPK